MKSKKISKEHLRILLGSFERDEKVNLFLMVITILNLIIVGLIYIYMNLLILSVLILILVTLIIIISYIFTYSFSLHLKPKKDKILIDNLKSYLVNGTKGKDSKLEKTLKKLTLTERHYKINQLKYFSYFLMCISIELFIFFLFENILILFKLLDVDITRVVVNYSIGLIINLPLFLFLTLRYVIFKSVRKIREIIYGILNKELTKIEERIEKIMDLKIKEFNFKKMILIKNLQKWSDLYLGSYFIGLRKILLISDYNNLTYSIGNEIYYYNLFFNLKLRINEIQYFNNINDGKKKENIIDDLILNLIKLNIKRLDKSIQGKILEKNERRNKIKTAQTWFAIISVPLSIIFSLVSLILLINL